MDDSANVSEHVATLAFYLDLGTNKKQQNYLNFDKFFEPILNEYFDRR
jgi:hypothetical protein